MDFYEDRPIFILANPRSGSTLFRLMLTVHPKIVIPPESEFIVRLFPRYGHIRAFNSDQAKKFLRDVSGNVLDVEGQWEISLDFSYGELVGLSYSQVSAYMYRYYAQAKEMSACFWGDKNNCHGNYVDLLAWMYPKARFIHLVRDGRACLNSYKKLNVDPNQPYAPLLPKDSEEVAFRWWDTVSRIDRHLKKYVPKKNRLEVRYEDLLTNPEQNLIRVCEFLGVEFDSSMLSFHAENQAKSLEPSHYTWKSNTFRPIDSSASDKWRNELTVDEVCLFEGIALKLLVRHGYLPQCKSIKYSNVSVWMVRKRFFARLKEVLRHLRVLIVRYRRMLS